MQAVSNLHDAAQSGQDRHPIWRSRIFWRLLAAYSILLTVWLAVLGWLLIRRIENHLLQEIRSNLEIKTLLVTDLVNRYDASEYQHQISRVAKEMNTRITLMDATGKVLADSHESPENMKNHMDRPEVQQAKVSTFGESTRYSDTVHERMMYVARRNMSGDVRYVRIARSLNSVEAETGWLRRAIWTATSIALMLGLLLSLFMARRISAPLVQLAAAADSIAGGDYGKKVFISASDEIGALATSFNSMSTACAAHISQMDHNQEQLLAIFRSMVEGVVVLDPQQTILLVNDAACKLLSVPLGSTIGQKFWQVFRHQQLNRAVERILASNDPYQCELELGKSEGRALALQGVRLPGEPHRGAILVFHDITHLRKLETVRQDFVANVSHELKTPLAVIHATVETLLDGAIHDSQHSVRFLERIRESAERLHRLVQDLLTLGRIESSQAPMELEPIVLHSAVEACVAQYEALAKANDVQLVMEMPSHPVTAIADHEALAEILGNLVDNAIKYTPAGGRVTLRWFTSDQQATVQVQDTGGGIPAKDLSRVFERFYRVDKARSRELGGTGLGLSIVKHLAQALGGSVQATSEVGRGSIFSVRLPLFVPTSSVAHTQAEATRIENHIIGRVS